MNVIELDFERIEIVHGNDFIILSYYQGSVSQRLPFTGECKPGVVLINSSAVEFVFETPASDVGFTFGRFLVFITAAKSLG